MFPVTAVIPTRDQDPDLLRRAIDSALAANVHEVIVVVDRSQELPSASPKTRFLPSPKTGISAALNYGIAKAQTEWLAFLDSDDFWLPGKEAQFKHPASATFTDYIRHGEVVACDRPLSSIFTDNIPCRSTTVIAKTLAKAVGGFDETLDYAQDWAFHCRVQLLFGWTRIPEPLAQIADLPTGHTQSANPQERSRQCARVRREFRRPETHPLATDPRKYLRGSKDHDLSEL